MPAKVLLVEDDNNLREIYQARLMAEGYTIVTARDGEEALGVAKAEMPDLIISDVMMPRVSGFEMLDILRNTEGLKDAKVIMLTALGQADDKTRANSLGADRYLVKSQVTLEDIVKTSHELLEGGTTMPAAPSPAVPAPADPVATSAPQPEPAVAPPVPVAAQPVVPAPDPAAAAPGGVVPAPPMPPVPSVPTAAEEQATIGAQIQQFVNNGAAPAAPAASAAAVQDDAVLASAVQDLTASSAPTDAPASTMPVPQPDPTPAPAAAASDQSNSSVPIANKKIIQPISGEAQKAPIHEILAREEAAGMHGDPVVAPAPATTFSPTTPGVAPVPPMGPVVSMPEITPGQPVVPPAAPMSPSDPNNIAL